MRRLVALALAAVLTAIPAAVAQDWRDYAPDRDPLWASRAFSETGTHTRNTPRYRYFRYYDDEGRVRYRRYYVAPRAPRYVYRPTYHDPSYRRPRSPQVYGYAAELHSRRHDIGRCAPPASATGVERHGEDRAKEAAIQAWMTEVMTEPGVAFADVKNAILDDRELADTSWRIWLRHDKPLGFQCGLADAGTRLIDKGTQWLRRDQLQRCTLRAVPCKPEPDSGLPAGVEKRIEERRRAE